jgi:uncharacterized BrkB/YihY/UPF0761 family membrane protein
MSEETPEFLAYMHRALEGLDNNLQIIREAWIASFALTFINLLGWALFALSLWHFGAGGSLVIIILALLVIYLTALLIVFGVRMRRYQKLWAGKLKDLEQLEERLAEQLGFSS